MAVSGALFADERRQPLRLLRGAAPAADAVGRRQRHQQGRRQRQVALGQGLGDKGSGHRGALTGHAAVHLADPIVGQAQLQRLVEQFRRQAGLGIRVMSQRTQHLQGEAFEHVHQHLLVVGERQVEQPVRIGLARSLRLLRRTLAGQAEAGTAAAVEQFLEGFAKIEAIRPVGLGDTVQYS